MGQLVKSFATLDKDSGSGNSTVTATANSQNTGRNARSVNFTFKAANCTDVSRAVNQAGKPEFVNIQSAATVVKGGVATLTLTGTSNSSKLTFSLGSGGTLTLTLPTKYTANGLETSNGTAITGDPGATQEYPFSIAFSSIAANTSINAKTAQVIVTDKAGHTSTCTVTQAAGDPYLNVTPASVDLAWDGTGSASFTVSTNTSYTIE